MVAYELNEITGEALDIYLDRAKCSGDFRSFPFPVSITTSRNSTMGEERELRNTQFSLFLQIKNLFMSYILMCLQEKVKTANTKTRY